MGDIRLNLRLPPQALAGLRAMALVTGLSPHQVVEAGLARYHDRLPSPLRDEVDKIMDARRRASARAAVTQFLTP